MKVEESKVDSFKSCIEEVLTKWEHDVSGFEPKAANEASQLASDKFGLNAASHEDSWAWEQANDEMGRPFKNWPRK